MQEIRLKTEVYPLEVIYAACYVFLDRAYFLLDGNKEEVIVKIKLKSDNPNFIDEFHNELINYGTFFAFSKKNKEIINSQLSRALFSNENEEVNIPWEDED